MSLSRDDILKVARLARLKLTPDEQQQFSSQLGQILDYVEILNQVDTSDVEPMAHAADLANVFREDMPALSLNRDEVLHNAPQTDGKYFLVPPILEGS